MSDRNDNGRWVLPEGWVWTTLGDIATLVGGGTPSRQVPEYFGGDIVWLTPTEIPKNGVSVISASRERITNLGLRKSSARVVPKGSVLLTSRASIGYVAIAGTDLTTNQGFASFIPGESVDNHFLAYWLKNIADDLEDQATGTTFKEISKSKLRELAIPLAPLPIQHLIVSEIEKQFTRLDAAVAALRRAKANLARYKAAVLKAAVEGRLVAQDPNDEPAAELLARILAERRAQWEAANPKKTYVEPKGVEVAGLGELPVGWVWATVDMLTIGGPTNGLYLPKDKYGSGTPILRIDDYQAFWSRASEELQQVDASASEISKYSLDAGDIVINRVNSPSHLGKCLVVTQRNLPSLFESNMMRLRLSGFVLVTFVEAYLNSKEGRVRLTANAKWAVNQASINQGDVGNTPIPLPPTKEQQRIVTDVDCHLTVFQATEQAIDANLDRAERLRQGVLGKAFRGELVANGEIAEV